MQLESPSPSFHPSSPPSSPSQYGQLELIHFHQSVSGVRPIGVAPRKLLDDVAEWSTVRLMYGR